MNKIPVWSAIRFAYAFTFGDIGTIIGLIWFPTLLIGILQFLPYALGSDSSDSDKAGGGAAALLSVACFAGGMLLYAVNAVSVVRQGLGLRKGGASFHFSVGLPEWRVLGANAICALIIGTLTLFYLSGFRLFAAFAAVPTLAGGAAFVAYALGGAAALVYVGVRLAFLIVPLVVSEERIDLLRSWTLGHGNFWRILIVALAVTVPLFVAQMVATVGICGPQLLAPLPATEEAMTTALKAKMLLLDRHMPELIGLFLILAPFNFGLTLGAEAAVYRALAPAARTA